jgi:hypothetical protein
MRSLHAKICGRTGEHSQKAKSSLATTLCIEARFLHKLRLALYAGGVQSAHETFQALRGIRQPRLIAAAKGKGPPAWVVPRSRMSVQSRMKHT